MKKYLIFLLFAVAGKMAIAQETLSEKIKRAFSLAGHWEIIKMDVVRASDVSSPSTVPEASIGKVSILVASELGSYGSFDITPGGSVSGSGEVIYNYRVAAGSAAGSTSIGSLGITIPVGGTAMLHGDDGVRKFTITGTADLAHRSIKLNAFNPVGSDLKMIIFPGGKAFTSVLWPPMSKVESEVIITGASLLLRATGVLSGIKVSFEAVKYVDLVSVFSAIEDCCKKTN